MTFEAPTVLRRLDEFEAVAGEPNRYVIALSGGLDSTVLAQVLAATRGRHGKRLLAVHVDHRLQPGSAEWADHCEKLAARLGIEFARETARVDASAGSGLEAAARDARYAALRRYVYQNDWLLSAHHRDDQAETLLLNLMRGSGPAGLAGIGRIHRFAAGWLARPLIDVSRAALESYAAGAKLDWLDDPSNDDTRFDRNYLRHAVLPILEQRWPNVCERLARSADLAGEAAALQDDLAKADLVSAGDRAERIDIGRLAGLSGARQRNLLRFAVRSQGLPMPGRAQLDAIVGQLIPARQDAQPLVSWPGAELRRYRGKLYVLPSVVARDSPKDPLKLGARPLELPDGFGSLALQRGAARGLSDAVVGQGLTVRYRKGGEEIRPVGQAHTRKLKKLLQEEGIVPWMRDHLPLVYANDRMVAVADLWIAAEAASEPGTAIRWRGKPALH